MKALIVGMGGVGSVIAKTLSKTNKFNQVICADLKKEPIQRVLGYVKNPRFSGEILNAASPAGVLKVAKNMDIVINATIPHFNLVIMEACLAAQSHYIDLATESMHKNPGRVDITQQYEMDSAFQEKGLTAICAGIGIDPGCSNIFARHLFDRMDTVEEILVRDGDASELEGYSIALSFSPDTAIDECLQPPLLFEDGRFITGKALDPDDMEYFTFPEPIGSRKVYAVFHEEVWTIPRYLNSKGLKRCNFKYGLPDDFISFLKAIRMIGLDSPDPIDVKGKKVAPRDVITALLPEPAELAGKLRGSVCVGTIVKGTKDGRKLEKFMYNHVSHEEAFELLGEQATSYQTGIPAALAADLIADGLIDTRGVLPPEALDPKPFIDLLPEYGIKITTEDL
jgi:saccharopine dehydrogenase (NAD+, L-lysine forming)